MTFWIGFATGAASAVVAAFVGLVGVLAWQFYT